MFFLSAPNSTTPTHIDLEQGYLLQLSGTKRVSIGDFPDSEVALREVERFCAGGHRNIADLPHDAETFEISPGEGVHVPALVPHLVKTPPTVSLSLSVGFETEAVLRRAAVHRANAGLRRLGLTPARPGARPGGDRAKEQLVATASRVAKLVRRGGESYPPSRRLRSPRPGPLSRGAGGSGSPARIAAGASVTIHSARRGASRPRPRPPRAGRCAGCGRHGIGGDDVGEPLADELARELAGARAALGRRERQRRDLEQHAALDERRQPSVVALEGRGCAPDARAGSGSRGR